MAKETYTPNQELAGSEQPHFASATVESGITCARLTPLGQVTATGSLAIWAPGASDGSEKAVYLAGYAVDTSGGAKRHKVIKSGHWNSDAIQWPDGTTDLQKALAFVGTPISHETL
ncbi:head decoration protein [Marinomonas spartinae]|uniref:head decoration protein n=1 Tax=Marinomonas spartinae TaxID=1792290 RepID=UPI0018F1ED81|nr:head decoration protein [Marinomonas spartinae]MBJ7555395.1 head decoration protein [Marinomonas spartinae]